MPAESGTAGRGKPAPIRPDWLSKTLAGLLLGLCLAFACSGLLMVSLVGLTLLPAAGMPIWQQVFAAGDLGVDAIRTHALALLERGLELPA